ncbi:hypothetical protein G2W53_002344 [Senna tora]|uniref:Uncharacterized protein n=1 Tax=Senna tora TaxID=362788 RepID=A0A834XHN8_9FABA|nr:hypothetical protein G2W53_002344 [Senna tora]
MAKFLFLCFILGNLLMDLTMAFEKNPQTMVVKSSCEAASIRKVGKQNSVSSPSMEPTESSEEEREIGSHHSVDKSIAGGGVILGGLATTFFLSVFCYIRATARHNKIEETQP